MANEINLKIKVGDDGTLNIVAKEANKAAKATDNLGKSTDKLNRTRDKTHKQEKSLHQAGLSGGKAFSKQAQTINGGSSSLVGAYAVLAANIFALTAAFGALQRAAQVQQLEQGLLSMGSASGNALRTLSDGLRQATGHALNLEDAMRATALASSAGFDSSSIERLGKVARQASIALGRDTADSLNRLTKGAIKLEPELLDELGIMVRLDEATETYATQVNKAAGDLTNFEKRQAFMNAVLEEGERKFSAMANVDTNPYDRLSATFNDLTKTLINILNKGIVPVVSFFASSQAALFGAMILFGKTIATSMIPALGNLGSKYAEAAKEAHNASLAQLKSLKNIEGGGANLKKLAKAYDPAIHGQAGLNDMMKTANNSYAVNDRQLKALIESEGEHSQAVADKRVKLQASQSAIDTLTQYQKDFNNSTIEESKTTAVAAAASGNYGAAMDNLGEAKRKMTEETKKATKGTGLFNTVVGRTGLIAKKAALNVKVLGTAFLNMIPMIGTIITVLGMAWSALMALNNAMKSNEQKEYEERLKKLKSALDEYGESLNQVTLFQKGLTSTITSTVGEATALSNVYQNMAKQLQNLESGDIGFFDQLLMSEPYQASLKQILKNQPAVRDQLADMAKEAGASKTAIQQLRDGGLKGYGMITEKLAKEILPDFLEEAAKGPNEIRAMGEAVKGAQQAFDEFANSTMMKTSVDNVVSGLQDIEKSFKDNGEATAEDWVKAFEETAGNNMKKAIDFDNIKFEARFMPTGAFGTPGYWKEVKRAIKAANSDLQKGLEKIQENERLSKNIMATEKSKIGVLKFRNGEEGNAVLILEAQQKIRDEEVKLLEDKITKHMLANSLEKENEDTTNTIKLLRQQINDLGEQQLTQEQKNVASAKENLSIHTEKMKVAQAVNTETQRGIDLLKRETDARQKIAELAQESANMADPRNRGKGDLSAAQRFRINYQDTDKDGDTLEKKRIDAITREFDLKIKMSDMEMDVLRLRLQILREEALEFAKRNKLPPPELSSIDGIIDNIDEMKTTAKTVLQAEKEAALAELNALRLSLLQEVKTQYKEGGQTASGVGSSNEAAAVLGEGTPQQSIVPGTPTPAPGSGTADAPTALDQIARTRTELQGLMETASTLGPGGELINAVAGGALSIADAWTVAGNSITGSIDTLEEGAAVATAASETFSQIGSIMAAASQAKVAGIDKEIAAEKKRDGKSKESLAKIKALEKKKENIQRKNFEMQKKLQMASIIADTAAAIMKNMGQTGIFGLPLVPMIAAMGAAQLAVVASQSFQGGGSSIEGAGAPTTVSLGNRRSRSDLSKSQSARGELAYFRGDQGIGGPENFRPAFGGRKHYATGGNMGYVVGEQGPELFMPDRPGTIVPADDTAAAMGGNTNVTFSINAIDASGVEEVLAQQQGNIIGMIRTAANSYGEEFMEDLDETTYTTPVARRA